MKIDGRDLANELLSDLSTQVVQLKEKGTIPTLAVILVGDNPNSISYIEQKRKSAEKIGATMILSHQPPDMNPELLRTLIAEYNTDSTIHGIIVQRPLPHPTSETSQILNSVDPKKDVDGFVPHSTFEPPVAVAVIKILEEIHKMSSSGLTRGSALSERGFPIESGMTLIKWLQSKNIVVLGRGETAGTPVAHALEKRQCTFTVIHSQTEHPKDIMKNADILISCVGKNDVVKADDIKNGAILIGVGLGRDESEKLRGDYDEKDVEHIASFYTPTPGGVGPMNVACLMQNVVAAATTHS